MRPSSSKRFCTGRTGKRGKRPRSSGPPRTYGENKAFARAFFRVGHSFVYLVVRGHPRDDVPIGASIPVDYWDAMGPEERERLVMALRRPSSQQGDSKVPSSPVDPAFVQDFPTLAAYLGDDTWEDGSPRLRSTLILFAEDDLYKMCLTDKDNDMTLWVASKTMWGLLGAMEGRLNDPEADWKKRKAPTQRPSKRS